MTDLVAALALGALTGFQLLNVTPSGAPIGGLPLALIPAAAVPLLLTLHVTPVSAPVRGAGDAGERARERARGCAARRSRAWPRARSDGGRLADS